MSGTTSGQWARQQGERQRIPPELAGGAGCVRLQPLGRWRALSPGSLAGRPSSIRRLKKGAGGPVLLSEAL